MSAGNDQPEEGSPQSNGWTIRALLAQDRTTPTAAGLTVALALGLSWLVSYVLGGAGRVPPHWFYIPILLASARFGLVGSAVAAAAAGILAGPFLPLDVASGTAQDVIDWTSRAGFFMAIGLVMGTVIVRLKTSLAREVELAKKERDLAVHKASVIATVSHEFRTPLTIILGVTQTLDHQAMVSALGRPLLDSLTTAGLRLDHLVATVLAAAEGLEGEVAVDARPLALREVVADTVAQLVRLGGTTRVRLTCEPGGDTVVSDAAILRQVVEHIIENALKFSPPESEVDVWVHRQAEGVELRVRDHGPGIAEGYLDSAFDAFAQQEPTNTRERGGLGLGLFASRKLVALLEGRLDLTRHPEGGTEVVLYVPDLRLDQPLAQAI